MAVTIKSSDRKYIGIRLKENISLTRQLINKRIPQISAVANIPVNTVRDHQTDFQMQYRQTVV